MKQTYLYLWYPLFQAQRDRCDKNINQAYNHLVKGHHLFILLIIPVASMSFVGAFHQI
jgi:hypothetical protein